MDQGRPEFDEPIADPRGIAEAFSIERSDFDSNLPVQVVSTGLRYLIVPLAPGVIGRARIASDITPMLERFNAQFAVLLDDSELEIRHWTNDGVVEDIATGSAAGTIGAYRLRHALIEANEQFALNQGRFTGRPSVLRVQPIGSRAHIQSVKVGGDVSIVGRGVLDVLP